MSRQRSTGGCVDTFMDTDVDSFKDTSRRRGDERRRRATTTSGDEHVASQMYDATTTRRRGSGDGAGESLQPPGALTVAAGRCLHSRCSGHSRCSHCGHSPQALPVLRAPCSQAVAAALQTVTVSLQPPGAPQSQADPHSPRPSCSRCSRAPCSQSLQPPKRLHSRCSSATEAVPAATNGALGGSHRRRLRTAATDGGCGPWMRTALRAAATDGAIGVATHDNQDRTSKLQLKSKNLFTRRLAADGGVWCTHGCTTGALYRRSKDDSELAQAQTSKLPKWERTCKTREQQKWKLANATREE